MNFHKIEITIELEIKINPEDESVISYGSRTELILDLASRCRVSGMLPVIRSEGVKILDTSVIYWKEITTPNWNDEMVKKFKPSLTS